MEAVIDYEVLYGRENEVVVKEVGISAKGVIHTFHFKSPYPMHPHGSTENGINCDDGQLNYSQLETSLSEAVAGYPHVYSHGFTKCQFLSRLLGRTILNLEDFGCPEPKDLKPGRNCVLPCHKFHSFSCATRNATSYYEWLKYHFQKKSCHMSKRQDASYRHVCFSRIKATPTTHALSLPNDANKKTSTGRGRATRTKTQARVR